MRLSGRTEYPTTAKHWEYVTSPPRTRASKKSNMVPKIHMVVIHETTLNCPYTDRIE